MPLSRAVLPLTDREAADGLALPGKDELEVGAFGLGGLEWLD